MNGIPDGINRTVIVTPDAIKQLNDIKKAKNNNKKPDNKETLNNSLDALSTIMQAKVNKPKSQEEIKKEMALKIVLSSLKNNSDIDLDSITKEDIEKFAESILEDGTCDEILNVGSRKFLEEIIKPALERMAKDKKAISVSDFEKLADKKPPKISEN